MVPDAKENVVGNGSKAAERRIGLVGDPLKRYLPKSSAAPSQH